MRSQGMGGGTSGSGGGGDPTRNGGEVGEVADVAELVPPADDAVADQEDTGHAPQVALVVHVAVAGCASCHRPAFRF